MSAKSRDAACISTVLPRQSIALASRTDCAPVATEKMASAWSRSFMSTAERSCEPYPSSWALCERPLELVSGGRAPAPSPASSRAANARRMV